MAEPGSDGVLLGGHAILQTPRNYTNEACVLQAVEVAVEAARVSDGNP